MLNNLFHFVVSIVVGVLFLKLIRIRSLPSLSTKYNDVIKVLPLGEDIIGEVMVVDKPSKLILSILDEARRIWSADNNCGWTDEEASGFVLQSKPVIGVYESAKPTIQRSSILMNHSCETVYNFLVSPKGFTIIDPVHL